MWRTLEETPGVALAAPQIGDDRAVVVVEDKSEFHVTIPPERLAAQERVIVPRYVLINPEVTPAGTETTLFFEGCLSVEDRAAVVERARSVDVTWLDEEGNPCSRRVTGWHARILQHEVDHLRGVLFVDRAHPRGVVPKDEFMDTWRSASVEKIRQHIGL